MHNENVCSVAQWERYKTPAFSDMVRFTLIAVRGTPPSPESPLSRKRGGDLKTPCDAFITGRLTYSPITWISTRRLG
jgi:hypothetical protein